MTDRDAVIVAALRTPVGVGKAPRGDKPGGALNTVHPVDLSAIVLRALAERTGLDAAVVDDVIWGCVSQVGEQSYNVARAGVLAAGWPESVPATSIDRQCGSSQQSVHFAAAGLISGQYDVVVAGGVESMSRVPMGSTVTGATGEPFGDTVHARYADELAAQGISSFNQGIGAEMIAQQWGFSRTDLDEFSAQSHALALAATESGAFADQLVPVTRPDGVTVTADEGIRPGTSVESLSALRTAFREDGVITAGNASQISDGSAGLLMMTSAKAAELGMTPLVRVHTAALAGSDPVIMLTGPIPATAKVLARSGLSIGDIDAYEVNEAFAPIPMAWLAETGADPAKLNTRGGAIALGHPLGASGARVMTTLVHRMIAEGSRYGLQAICEGGGMANATILERC